MKCAAGRLETRTTPEVSGFPERLHKLPHLERWQIGQAGAALALLYEEVLRIGLGKIELPRADASEGPGGGGDRFSSVPPAAQRRAGCAVVDGAWVNKLYAQLRPRHYRLRTGREPSAPGFVDVADLSVLRCD
jgi:hypothetical protein